MPIIEVVEVLGKLIAAGIAVRKAASAGFGEHDLEVLEKIVGAGKAVKELAPKKGSPSLAALHLALVTGAFGEAWRRHWVDDVRLAPKDLSKRWQDYLLLPRGERTRKEYVARALTDVVSKLTKIGDDQSVTDLALADRLLGDPVNTPYYGSLWSAFTDPVDEALRGELLVLADDGARAEFERHFRLAYGEALASSNGAAIRDYLKGLRKDRSNLVMQLLVRDLAGWGRRHLFGNGDPGEAMPWMSLDAMYVEPFAVRAGEPDMGRAAPPMHATALLREALQQHSIVIVTADFGHGKSLTARALAAALAREHLLSHAPGPTVPLPIHVRCADDLSGRDLDVRSAIRRALWRQAKSLGLSYAVDDTAFDPPPLDWKTIVFFDGLDEVNLSEGEVRAWFESLRENASDHHRYVVLSRPAALPRRGDRKELAEIQLLPWTVKPSATCQVTDWLQRWNAVAARREPLTIAKLKEHDLVGIATTPILLFMIAQTWDALPKVGESLNEARIYETFFRQIARGKHELDVAEQKPVAEASRHIQARLAERGDLDDPDDPVEAMLWLMSRVAWETKRLPADEPLSEFHVTRILRDELGLRETEHAERIVRLGVLLALQANLGGGARKLLFGHKSFVEFLAARYWCNRLRRLPKPTANQRELELESQLSGARLLGGNDDRTFAFVSQMLATLAPSERHDIFVWAEGCFNEERIKVASNGQSTSLRCDTRAGLREAALAIASCVRGDGRVRARDTRSLRSLLAYFWFHGRPARISAPGFLSPGAELEDSDLSYADLSGADLQGARLGYAELYRARLTGADLRLAVMTQANLRRADLCRANLTGADLTEARVSHVNLRGADLSRASLGSAELFEVNAQDAVFDDAALVEARLPGAKLVAASLRRAQMQRSDLDGADLSRACLDGANLVAAKLAGAKLVGASLVGADLSRASLRNADLRAANLKDARLDGADLTGAKLDATS